MRLIGLNIDRKRTNEFILKGLKDDWYPFGNYDSHPPYGRLVHSKLNDSIYNIPNCPHLTVSLSCIVGKNGSGKSTIIDIVYAIINNFSYTYLRDKERKYNVQIESANGIYADLVYELDGKIGIIKNENNSVTLFFNNEKISTDKFVLHKHLSEAFFYTIGLNYSIYSFNTNDYACNEDPQINGIWLDSLFHKNDGYLSPICLNPFRELGNIDINKENSLALKRLSAFALFFESRNQNFIPGYRPVEIEYMLISNYEKYIEKKVFSMGERMPVKGDVMTIYDRLKESYSSSIPQRGNKRIMGHILSYLAYKTIKIALTYADFYSDLRLDRLDILMEKIADDSSHITLKIKQCMEFAKKSIYNKFGGNKYRIDVKDILKNQEIKSYEDVFKLLPPPFYDLDVIFSKEEKYNSNISFKRMSSGEQQLLFSVSTILYHLKNLESVNDDTNRVHYEHICIILDEIELYSHPEFQRNFINDLLEKLSWIKLEGIIKSIHFLLVTHSPFILSDVLTENTLYLNDGKYVKKDDYESFGANYYKLLKESFFLGNNAIGEIASKTYKSICNGEIGYTDDLFGDPLMNSFIRYIHKNKQ